MNRVPAILLAVMLAAAPAFAQPANPAADAALAEGRRLYDLQEWDLAIAKFKEAYRMRADAPALFNIAQSYRLKGDCAQAASFYKTFRRNFPAVKPEQTDKLVVEMEACAKAPKTTTEPKVVTPPKTEPKVVVAPPKVDPPKPDPTKPDPMKAEPTKAEPTKPVPTVATIEPIGGGAEPDEQVDTVEPGSPGKGMRTAGLVLGGVGVVGIAGGVVLGLKASGFASDAEGLARGSTWDPELERRGKVAQRNSRLSFGIGAAALIGGGVLYMLGRKAGQEQPAIAVVPVGDGAHVVWTGGF